MGDCITQAIANLSSESTEFKRTLNILIKYEIHGLLQRLSDTGEEAILITTSATDVFHGYLGTQKGQRFLREEQALANLKDQFLKYCAVSTERQSNGDTKEAESSRDTSGDQGETSVDMQTADDVEQASSCGEASLNGEVHSPRQAQGVQGSRSEVLERSSSSTSGQSEKAAYGMKLTASLPRSAEMKNVGVASIEDDKERIKPRTSQSVPPVLVKENQPVVNLDVPATGPPLSASIIPNAQADAMPQGSPVFLVPVAHPKREKISSSGTIVNPSPKTSSKGRSLILTITTCYICRQEFPSYDELKKHMLSHTAVENAETANAKKAKSDLIACGICEFECSSSEMKSHLASHHLDMEGEESEAVDLESDMLMSSEFVEMAPDILVNKGLESDIACTICGFRSKDLLEHEIHMELHMQEDDDTEDRLVGCGVCEHQCHLSELSAHLESHNMEDVTKKLDSLFTESTLNGNASSRSENKIFTCSTCTYTATRRSRMREHVQTCCVTEPQFSCEYCGKLFRAKRYLRLHKKSHQVQEEEWLPSGGSSNQFECDKCSYRTYRAGRLREHKSICGVKDQQFECPVCYKKFKAKRYMSSHVKTHLTNEGLMCKHCGFLTFSPADFISHMQQCSNDLLKFSCDKCQRRFAEEKQLKRHIAAVHLQDVKVKVEPPDEDDYVGGSASVKMENIETGQVQEFLDT